ncbi:MAG: hypothetical protein M5U34_12920 [Chloroflexi bacterium]|nr:hypothetical protein [Chloroflexota bacterium]
MNGWLMWSVLSLAAPSSTTEANVQSPENPVTPTWYAQVFNGYGVDPTLHDNALEVIRNENPRRHKSLSGR